MNEPSTSVSVGASAYIETWCNQWSDVLSQISGGTVPCATQTESPGESLAASPTDLWMSCACSGAFRGEMCLRFAPVSALRLAQTFMSEPLAPDTPLNDEHREALLELVRQVTGLVASALKSQWGEVQLRIDPAEAAPSWPSASSWWLRVGDPADVVWVEMHLSAALLAALRAHKGGVAAGQSATSETAHGSTGEAGGFGQLGLLRDVELAVTLGFGERRMLLREVLDLNPGAVVELDRQINEPVDLLLDGRLLARGEVVVVEGNYGLRVTEVAPFPG